MHVRPSNFCLVIGDKNSTSYREQTRPFRFPQIGYPGREYDGFIPCRTPACGACADSPQAVPLHYDCLAIFIRECSLTESDALARLWTIGCYRNPWPKTPLLHLAPHERVDQAVLRRIAGISGCQLLRSLPLELVELVRQAAPHTLFWRAISTITMAGRLMTPSQPSRVLPLRDIEVWERGGQVMRVSQLGEPGPMRLEIDSDGIRKIDRFAATSEHYPGPFTNNRAYILEKDDDLTDIDAYLKVCTKLLSVVLASI